MITSTIHRDEPQAIADIRTTRAAILVEQHQPLIFDEIELPERLDVGQVLVRVAFSGVCGSQVGEIDGAKGADRYLPHLLGHEGGGVVLDVGLGVTHVKPGDHVVMHWRPGRGIEARPATYRWRGEKLNAGWVTTFNEYAVVSENRLTPISGGFPLDEAALFGCPVTTGLGVVCRDAELTLGQSIVVIGVGGVGQSVVQGAAMLSANPIVAIDLSDAKLELARRLGATHAINSSMVAPDRLDAVVRDALAAPDGADVVVENTGHVPLIELAYGLAKSKGRTVLVGVPRKGQAPQISTLPLHFGKVLTGSHGGSAEPAEDIPRYASLHAAGKLNLAPLITDRLPLEQVNQAIERLRAGDIVGRCILEMPVD